MSKTFKQLGLGKEFVKLLEKLEITVPTEIQEKAIPCVLKGKDVIGSAETGSGKTLAFMSGVVENMEPSGKSRVLVLTPTRELAEQVASEFRRFAIKKFRVFALYGGIKIEEHVKKIKGADIVVATPGRLLDIINRQAFNLNDIEVLVLDEFDRMLDMGFQRDVELILKKCPEKRQTMLFSATKTGEIDKLIEQYTNKPKEINVESRISSSKLKQIYYKILQKEKLSLLYHLIEEEKNAKSMIFCSTRTNADSLGENLERLGFEIEVIHGGLDQKKRTSRLNRFHREGGILICTDVAARGLDIKEITHIYNYDLPPKPEDYIHRIGRTARAGKSGKAISFMSPRNHKLFNKITELPNIQIKEMDLPDFNKVNEETLHKKVEQIPGKTHIKKRGVEWLSIDDPALSNRFRKRTVEKNYEQEEMPKKKTRRAGAKRKSQSSSKGTKKVASHKLAKKEKVTRGRAGNRNKTKKINRRPKGRANRKTKK